MSLATWRSPLARALHFNRSLVYSRYFQLATIASDGYPANRTVVFRGFLGATNQIKIITDSRSQKAHQIQVHPQGEICWYFPKSREQFRFRGDLSLIDGDHQELQSVRRQMWQDISPAARSQFFGEAPGEAREIINQANQFAIEQLNPEQLNPEQLNPEQLNPEQAEAQEQQEPATSFCLLFFDSFQVDHLELRGDFQRRHKHIWDGNCWTMIATNP